MTEYFSAEFFAANRRRLRESVAGGVPIVITANGLLQRGGDIPFAFQQDASFWYLTGIDWPDVVVVMEGDEEYLIVPTREFVREAFEGVIDPENLTTTSGVRTVLTQDEGWHRLGIRLQKSKRVATLAANPTFIEQLGFYTSPSRRTLARKLKSYNDNLEFDDLRDTLARMRMVKQKPELQAIQAAIDITVASLQDALEDTKRASYKNEFELEAEIGYGFRKRGAMGHAFDPIVAAGKNAATIHSMTNNSQVHTGDLVVLDVGAEVQQYDADITRTVCLRGEPTKRQRAVYEALLAVQEFALNLQRPGALIRENEKAVEEYMGDKLRELGLIKSADREAIRHYFPHATSHFLGIDPHDAGDYDAPLAPGVVITVEPGIYIPEEGIGARIEDDVLITENGFKNLSGKLSREL